MLRQGRWVLITAFAAAQLSCAHAPAPVPRGEPIAAGLEVTMAYTVTQTDGTLMSTTEGRAPFSYLHGQGEILPALEQALTGLRAGEQRRIAVPAEQAFGLFNEAKVVTLPRQQFPPDMTVGSRVQDQIGRTMTIRAIEEESVVVDLNHPLAGKDLIFTVRILKIRKPGSPPAGSRPADSREDARGNPPL